MLSTIDKRGSKIDRNSVFDCHLSPVWRQMAIENSVSNNFYLISSIVLAFSIAPTLCVKEHIKNVLCFCLLLKYLKPLQQTV